MTRLLLAFGVIGPLLNIVVVLILGATRPDYSAWRMPDSALELGEGGWIQVVNCIVTGALVLGCAVGLKRVLRTGRGSTWAPILLGVYGVTFIGAGIFLTDPSPGYPPGASSAETVRGIIHDLFGLLQFASAIAASIVLARRDAADSASRGWARYSVATGIVVIASYVAFVLTIEVGGPAGLVERIGIFAACAWIALLAMRLLYLTAQKPG